jgi:ribonuclease HI
MKQVTIVSVGSCDASTRLGSYEIALEYEGKSRYVLRELRDTTANRAIIQGLIDGVELLKEPCEVTLVAACRIGVRGISLTKGSNIDLLRELEAAIDKKQCKAIIKIREGEGAVLRQRVRSAAKQAPASAIRFPGDSEAS